MLSIFITKIGLFSWNMPVYTKRIIQNAYTTISFRMIELIAFILEHRRFA